VGWAGLLVGARGAGGIAGAHGDADGGGIEGAVDFAERVLEVFFEIVCEGAQRGDVEALDGVREGMRGGGEGIEDGEEGGEGLAGAGGGGDEDALAGGDEGPGFGLGGGWGAVAGFEPVLEEGGVYGSGDFIRRLAQICADFFGEGLELGPTLELPGFQQSQLPAPGDQLAPRPANSAAEGRR
jgi:hypothetical protein